MNFLKYTFLFAVFNFCYTVSFGQCAVPSSNPNKFTVIESKKVQVAENDNIKHFTGSVILQINDYRLKADSVVIFPGAENFEAYGNVTLVKKDAKFISASSAVYRQDAHLLNFMENVISYYDNQPAIAKSSATYDVSQ